jgi:hypothetical protein
MSAALERTLLQSVTRAQCRAGLRARLARAELTFLNPLRIWSAANLRNLDAK